jgi:Flp pilus assembly protein TadG
MIVSATRLPHARLFASLARFRDDERGALAFFMVFAFLIMIMFGGIAVDVMRFETRRVALQQTMDRAALAAASLNQTRPPQEIAEDWFEKAGLGEDLAYVEFSAPTVNTIFDPGQREVKISARVRSYNYFMRIMTDVEYLEGPSATEAKQGVSNIEVMLVLDITGSMGSALGDGRTKIEALREAASEFVTILKENDDNNGVSIGIVPYAAQVNVPANLRSQFNETNLSTWDLVANAGVPNINCMEFPVSTYGTTGISLTSPIPMAAVADSNSSTTTTAGYVAPQAPVATSRACTTLPDNTGTPYNEEVVNHVVLPTKDPAPLIEAISRLQAQGNTYIAVGMRWGSALLDEKARPIYTAIGDPSVAGRPADNLIDPDADVSLQTRKIIVLMTDGEHVTNNHIFDAYKSGLSPIYLGTDGNYAIRFTSGGPALTNGTRPGLSATNTCSGWVLGTGREYFVNHLKRNNVRLKVGASEPEGFGTGTNTAGACEPRAWVAGPTGPWNAPSGTLSWPVYDSAGNKVKNSDGTDRMIQARQLDWSEVWRFVRVSWMARQLYMRSGVSGTGSYDPIMNTFRGTYLSSVANMNSLLQTNCTAARAAGMEIYGIAFAAPTNGQTQINGCASSPKENYYYNATDSANLLSAFRKIATDISDLRLTQ